MTRIARTVSAGAGFWIVAAVFFVAMSYSTVPTPLYPIYQDVDGFPVWMITVIFAAYAVGVVGGLLFLGPVSDWAGRRRMALIALVMLAVSAVVFILSTAVPALLIARVINGVSIGILAATATAHLGELRARARPGERPVVAASVAAAANIGGLALGPVVGGLCAEFLPDPLLLPHVAYLVVIVLSMFALAAAPESVASASPPPRYRPQRLAVPTTSRSAFAAAGLGAFSAFAFMGTFTSLAPTFLVGTFGDPGHLLAGLTAGSALAAAAVAQVALVRVALRIQLTIAIISCVVGVTCIALGAFLPSVALFVLGGVIAGVGVGILFRSAVATTSSLARPEHHGETLALLFLIAYTGLIIPVLSVGVSLEFIGEQTVLTVFATLVLVATVAAGFVMRSRARA